MKRKYFPLDKNYLLEHAQLKQEEFLIRLMVEDVISFYLTHCNPLGIEDDLIIRLKNYSFDTPEIFSEFYRDLAGIYRFQKGKNQLELLFDGTDHFTKYSRDWGDCFCNWLKEFCLSQNFVKAVFMLTVFEPGEHQLVSGHNRLKYFLSNYFELKIHKHKGILRKKVA
jgi:hypothetical protein